MINFILVACVGFLLGVFIGYLVMCEEDKK